MIPITPSGTRTRSIRMPFGRVQDSVIGTNGILERPDNVDTRRDGLDPPGVEREAVEKRSRDPGSPRFGDILGVGGENRGSWRAYGRSHALQRAILLLGRGKREHHGLPRGRDGRSRA